MLVLSNLVNIITSLVIMQYIFSIILQFTRTKNVPWHILAPAAVACDTYLVRRSAHPERSVFYILGKDFRSVYKELHADHETGAADNK